MANKKADVVIVGVGWVGGIIAAELTRAGLDVVGLERGHTQHRGVGPRDEKSATTSSEVSCVFFRSAAPTVRT